MTDLVGVIESGDALITVEITEAGLRGLTGVGLKSASIIDGILYLTKTDDTEIEVGKIVPEKGVDYYTPSEISAVEDDVLGIVQSTLDEKADKVVPQTVGNIPKLDSEGNLVDTGFQLLKTVPSNAAFMDSSEKDSFDYISEHFNDKIEISDANSAVSEHNNSTDAHATLFANKVSTSTKINGHSISGDFDISQTDVGLGNVDNTSDANKPISIAQAAVNSAKADKLTSSANGHLAEYDSTGNLADSGLSADTVSEYGEQISQLDAKFLSLQTAVSVTNMLYNRSYSFVLANGSVLNGEATFTATAEFGHATLIPTTTNIIVGHIYYFRAKIKASSANVKLYIAKNSTGGMISAQISHSGSGNYEILEGTFTATTTDAISFRVVDYRSSGFTEIKVAEAMYDDLTVEYGASYEPAISSYKASIYTYNNSSYFVENTLTIYIPKDTSYKPRLFVDVASGVINVISKYNANSDMRYVLNKKGPNTIFDFAYFYKIANSTLIVSTDKTAGTLFNTNGTDSFGPYIIEVTTNIDGDTPYNETFTGGNHGYNGDATGCATGRTSAMYVYVDGRAVTSFSGFSSCLDIEWVNYVQAYNTKKSDGSGREVLIENYCMHYDGFEWSVECKIEPLEEVIIKTYYGMQLSVVPWNGYTLFQSSTNNQWYSGNTSCNAGSKTCDIITHKKNGDYADMELNLVNGMGKGGLLASTAYNAFRANYDKSYFYLVDSAVTLTDGTVLTWKGKYRFYPGS